MKAALKVTSEGFKNGKVIPSKYTCDGDNISPSLIVSGLPLKTKTLVLIMEDVEDPEKPILHWIIWNISPTNKVMENNVNGEVGLNDFNKRKYSGPCPKEGMHTYTFRVYALDNFLNLNSSGTKQMLEAEMEKHIVGYGELSGLYERRKGE